MGHANRIENVKGFVENSFFSFRKVKKVGLGGNHTLVLLEGQELYGMGNNKYGQCGIPNAGFF